jgi:UTP--glucose-1-phosphate uridylyltransferase
MRVVGIVLAAGFGTRFLPLTRTVPKELLPLGLRPAISHIIDEYRRSGIDEIVLVTSRRKHSIEDLFSRDRDLEVVLSPEQRARYEDDLVLAKQVRLSFVHQDELSGTGTAILQTRHLVRDAPCVVAYPDDVHWAGAKTLPLAAQLVEVYGTFGVSVLSLEQLGESDDISRYGVPALGAACGHNIVDVDAVVEKPTADVAPSRMVVVGRYLISPDCMEELYRLHSAHTVGEFFLTTALNEVAQKGRLKGRIFDGARLDLGQPHDYFISLFRYLLQSGEVPGIRTALERLLQE